MRLSAVGCGAQSMDGARTVTDELALSANVCVAHRTARVRCGPVCVTPVIEGVAHPRLLRVSTAFSSLVTLTTYDVYGMIMTFASEAAPIAAKPRWLAILPHKAGQSRRGLAAPQ